MFLEVQGACKLAAYVQRSISSSQARFLMIEVQGACDLVASV